jgi:hypothetical protein
MAKNFDKTLVATVSALEAELQDIVLAKAEDEAPAEGTDDSASPPAAEGPAAGPATDGPPPDAAPAPDASAPAPDAAPAPAGDPAAEAPTDPAALQAEYAALPPDQLMMHIQAALAAQKSLMGAAGAGAPADASMGPAGAPPVAPPAPMMGKAALNDKAANGGVVSKSEVAALKAEIEELKKSVSDAKEGTDVLAKWAEKVVSRPERKAVTGDNFLGKSQTAVKPTYTPAEARALLNANLHKLTKSERDTVVKFHLGHVKADALGPIFEKVTK